MSSTKNTPSPDISTSILPEKECNNLWSGIPKTDPFEIAVQDSCLNMEKSIPPFEELRSNIKEIPDFKKSVEASKAIFSVFNDRMKKYPFHISIRGCEILCVAISLETSVSIKEMPSGDVDIIKSKFPSNANPNKINTLVDVQFDDDKDFKLTFQIDKDTFELYVFNSLKDAMSKNYANKSILLPKENYKPENMIDIRPQPKNNNGKNAFEIRRDMLEMAIRWMTIEETEQKYKKPSDDDLLKLAKKFYDFVENKK